MRAQRMRKKGENHLHSVSIWCFLQRFHHFYKFKVLYGVYTWSWPALEIMNVQHGSRNCIFVIIGGACKTPNIQRIEDQHGWQAF